MARSGKTASGFDENVAGALCYGLGWVTGLCFLRPSRRTASSGSTPCSPWWSLAPPASRSWCACDSVPWMDPVDFRLLWLGRALADSDVQGLSGRAVQAAGRRRNRGTADLILIITAIARIANRIARTAIPRITVQFRDNMTTALSESSVLDALRAVRDPDLNRDIVSLKFVKNLRIDEAAVSPSRSS